LRSLIHSPEGQAAIGNARATCDWHFNPPSAPHFGGLWEAAVRSTKRLLVRVIGNHIFTYEEFSTILVRVEAVLNSRPLTPASTDPHDLDCLTPGHFLIGQPLLAVPPRSDPASVRDMSNRWKLLDQCHQAFWRRWSSEYLTTLQERSKWTSDTPNLNVNDMVIVIDNQSPPLSWRLGRVIKLLPGTDGRVRVARVLTKAWEIVRPVVKLVLLPTEWTLYCSAWCPQHIAVNYHAPHLLSLVWDYCYELCVPLDRSGVGTGGALTLYYFTIFCLFIVLFFVQILYYYYVFVLSLYN